MESRVKLLGHSVHQILIVFPLGLLSASAIFELSSLVTPSHELAAVTFWLMISGVIGGLAAAPFGWIDWFAIPWKTRAKRIGLIHGLANVMVLGIFILNIALRWRNYDHITPREYSLTFVGVFLALFGGWLGGELVSRLGVAVYDGAHLNSPNSLSGRHAGEQSER